LTLTHITHVPPAGESQSNGRRKGGSNQFHRLRSRIKPVQRTSRGAESRSALELDQRDHGLGLLWDLAPRLNMPPFTEPLFLTDTLMFT